MDWPADMDIKDAYPSSAWIPCLILGLVGLAVGLYLIGTTALISADGTVYIAQAKQFGVSWEKGIHKQFFGYPLLIYGSHRIFWPDSTNAISWVHAAQGINLACRLGACLLLFGMARRWIGPYRSFMAVLILLLLPYPARFGSDVMRDWPYLLFLIAGMGALLAGCRRKRTGWFAVAGCLSGIAYLIRLEGAQVVLLGVAALGVEWFVRFTGQARRRLVLAGLLLAAGFFAGGGWHMVLRGQVLPDKLRFVDSKTTPSSVAESRYWTVSQPLLAAISRPPQWDTKAFVLTPWVLFKQTAECMSQHVFVVGVIGLITVWRRLKQRPEAKFWIGLWVGFQLFMLVYLHTTYGYISRRHLLAIVVALSLFVPAGLEVVSGWIWRGSNSLSNPAEVRRWMWILLAIGIGINLPKLAMPLRGDKREYRQVSQWLAEHTPPNAELLVDDPRIGLYSDRPYGFYKGSKGFSTRTRFWATIQPQRTFEIGAMQGISFRKVFAVGSKDKEVAAVFEIVPSDIIVRWTMNDATHSARISDAGQKRWHGTAFRNTDELSRAGKFDKAIHFDGKSDQITVRGYSMTGFDAWTVAAWVKCEDTPNPTLISFGGLCPSVRLQNNNEGRPILHMGVGNHRYFSASAWTTLKDGQWHHVAFTVPGKEPGAIRSAAMYLDGEAVAPDVPVTKAPQSDKRSILLGSLGTADRRYFSGDMDEVYLFNRALTAGEIEQLYHLGQ